MGYLDNFPPLSQRVLRMAESETLRMAALARELKAQGHEVINLSIGEPDFDTPDHIKNEAKKALDEGFTKYTPVQGIPELREAICTKFKRDNNLTFKPNQIVVSNGAKQSLANIFYSLLDEGDEVVILAPYWVSYVDMVKVTGGHPVIVYSSIEQDYKSSAEQIEQAITPRTKALLFSSPCNPTGSVYTHAELAAIAQMLSAHPHVTVISDEIYEYINFTGQHASIGTFEEVADRTVTVNGFSKGFAMTGWRLGYIGAPEWLANACTKIQGQYTSGANSFGQKAAVHALLSDLAPTHHMKEAFLQRRNMVAELLGQIPGFKVNLPQGAFYSFPDISNFFGTSDGHVTIRNADDFSEYIINKAHVALVSGTAFGAEQCIRISYAASEEELRTAIQRIAETVKNLK
jgi:aspartate aminotransferase